MRSIATAVLITALTLAATARAQSRPDPQQLRDLREQIAASRSNGAAHTAHEQRRAAEATAKADACRASFPERHADAKRADAAYTAARAQYQASGAEAKLAWFAAHCRFLSPLEIAIRKLDDENAFVCDTAKGRPAGLTAAFLAQYSAEASIGAYQERAAEDAQCQALDAAERVSLVLSDENTAEAVAARLLVLCFEDDRASCVQAREQIAQHRKAKSE